MLIHALRVLGLAHSAWLTTASASVNGALNAPMIQERRINYVLKTGANWAGPIRSFKLTIDPGASDHLVSFCPGRLKPTGPNALEFTAKDFTPESDLKILIVGRF